MDAPVPSEVTRASVLDAVIAHLWHEDESTLRIADLCVKTGLSSSVIYNNYHSRQGLIDAAYLEIYRTMTLQLVSFYRDVAATARDAGALQRSIEGEIANSARADRWVQSRQMRLRISAAALRRPALQRNFVLLHDHYLNQLSEIFADLQRRGIAGDLLQPRQLAIMFEGSLLFHSFNDIALHPIDDQSWLAMLMAVMGAFSSSPPSPAAPTLD